MAVWVPCVPPGRRGKVSDAEGGRQRELSVLLRNQWVLFCADGGTDADTGTHTPAEDKREPPVRET